MNLNSIGVVYDYQGQYALSIEYYEKSSRLYKEIGNEIGVATCLGNIGVIHQNQGKYELALKCYEQCLKIYEKENDKYGLALILGNLGNVYDYQGRYPIALELYQKSLKMYEDIENSQGIALILGNIGIIHQNESNYEKALQYHIRSKRMYEEMGDRYGLSMSLTNIGNAYLSQKKLPLALAHYEASLKLSKEIENKFGEAISLSNLAILFSEKNDNVNASLYYLKSLKISEELQDKQRQASIFEGLARIELKEKNYDKSLRYAHKGLAIAQEINTLSEISQLSFTIFQLYKLKENYKTALQYHELYKSSTDSLFDVDKEEALANMEAKADLELKEKEITVLNKNKEMLESGKSFQQLIIFLVSAGLILVCILSYSLYHSRQNERKAKEIIAQQKEEVLKQKEGIQLINDRLLKQTDQLAEANASKNKLFSILGHDLRSPIGSLESILGLMSRGIISKDEFYKILPQLHRNVQNVQITLDNLLHWSISQMSGLTLNPTQLSIKELADEQVELFAEVSKAKNIQVASVIDRLLTAWADQNHVRLVLRNLLNNALKFTHSGGKVTIDAKQVGSKVVISIQDTGIGMNMGQINELFQSNKGRPSRGTGGEHGTGLGLQLCMEVARLNSGELTVISEEGKGSTFFFSLPATGLQKSDLLHEVMLIR